MVEKWYVLMLYHEEIGLDCMCSNNLDYFKIHIWFTAKRTKLKGYQKGTIHTTQTTLGTRHRRRTKKNRTQNFSLFHDSWLSWSHHFESVTIANTTWLTVMEYLCHKWPRICSTCRKHFPVLSSFVSYHRVCIYINTTGVTSGAGNVYPSVFYIDFFHALTFILQKRSQTMSIWTMTLESVCKIYPRRWHLNGNSYSTRRIYLR